MISPIHKIFTGSHVDLSKVIAINPVEFEEHEKLTFTMDIQLRDGPLKFWIPLSSIDERRWIKESYTVEIQLITHEWVPIDIAFRRERGHPLPGGSLAVSRLNKKLDDLIDLWKKVREEHS